MLYVAHLSFRHARNTFTKNEGLERRMEVKGDVCPAQRLVEVTERTRGKGKPLLIDWHLASEVSGRLLENAEKNIQSDDLEFAHKLAHSAYILEKAAKPMIQGKPQETDAPESVSQRKPPLFQEALDRLGRISKLQLQRYCGEHEEDPERTTELLDSTAGIIGTTLREFEREHRQETGQTADLHHGLSQILYRSSFLPETKHPRTLQGMALKHAKKAQTIYLKLDPYHPNLLEVKDTLKYINALPGIFLHGITDVVRGCGMQ